MGAVMVDIKELEEKAKSKFGKYTPEKPTPFMAFLGKYVFRTRTPLNSFVGGAISAGTLVYWAMTKNILPLCAWLLIDLLMSLGARFYWRAEGKRLDREITRLNSEIQQINQEVNERKQYFEKIKEDLAKSTLN
ncbi:hypothetical protein NO2_1452 [Candidatus Termititenax persephonae]|uniref:Uncharacterized protein n=1 Tax=Candidatus Termititenax persephonae TaxID=2218525 RepID=A0A388TJE9_9BACT|nr:hypothetical protein NO2_1452 [Candidatus Termititenax persephonae]